MRRSSIIPSVSLEDRARQAGVVRVLPYRLFLDALWDREFTP